MSAYLDFRTGDGVPFLHRGMYFDSYEAAVDYDIWMGLRKPPPSKEELAAKAEAERVAWVSAHQPWEER